MYAHLFSIIAVAATVAFVVGIISGIWLELLIGMGIALLFLWLVRRL